MKDTWKARVLNGGQSTSRLLRTIHRHRLKTTARKVGLLYQSIVSRAKNDAVE